MDPEGEARNNVTYVGEGMAPDTFLLLLLVFSRLPRPYSIDKVIKPAA